MNKFQLKILNYCKLHPSEDSAFILKSIEEIEAKKKAERRHWHLISEGLKHYDQKKRSK